MAALIAEAEAHKHADRKDLQQGIKYLVDSEFELNKVPLEYIFPVDKRPEQTKSSGEGIPCIDLSGLQKSPRERESVISALTEACSEWGFFRVINHGVDESLMEKMMEATNEFFGQPHENKMRYTTKDVLNPIRYGTSFNFEVEEYFIWRDYLKHFCYPEFHAPENPPKYREVAAQYFGETRKLALTLLAAISEGLGLGSSYIPEEALQGGFHMGILNFYPECPEPNLTWGFSKHSDHGFLTILMQNDVAGLQIHHGDSWIQVPPIHGSFVVNVGDQLEVVSNGRFRSVEHAAAVNSSKTRISVASANGPALDALVAPAPQLVALDKCQKYKSMMYSDYLNFQQGNRLDGKSKLDFLKI